MILIRLWEHSGTGLLVPYPTGISYSNQAGGHSCFQPCIEGFFIPIANDVGLAPSFGFRSPENELFEHFRMKPSWGEVTEADADYIETIIHKWPMWTSLRVDRGKLSESMESWVFVTVEMERVSPSLIEGMEGRFSAILTWTNSD